MTDKAPTPMPTGAARPKAPAAPPTKKKQTITITHHEVADCKLTMLEMLRERGLPTRPTLFHPFFEIDWGTIKHVMQYPNTDYTAQIFDITYH